MKRLLIGGLAVGSLLFAASGVAAASTTATPLAAPTSINLDKTTLTSSVGGGSWPLAAAPGTLSVAFSTPASTQKVSGYAVTCKAPVTTADKLTPISLPNMVATFAVNPATGTSTDPDYDNTAGTTTLTVGPYSVFVNNELPPFTCTVVVTNAGGASKAGKANTATSIAPSGDCSPDGTGATTGLETILGGGGISQLTGAGHNQNPVAPSNAGPGPQTATNYDIVLADLSGFGGPAAVPFCSTNNTYNQHLLSDQPVTFSPTVTAIPAVTLPVSKAHPAQVTVSKLGLSAAVRSGVTLTVLSSQVVYAYDAYDFAVDLCKPAVGVSCITNTAAIIAGSGGQLPATPGVGYIAVVDPTTHSVLPGKPIIGSPISVTFHKTLAPNPSPPAFLGLSFGGAQTTIAVGAAPGVPVQVAPPAPVIAKINASFVSVPTTVNPASTGCVSNVTGPASAGNCLPYSALSGHANPYTGGDLNAGSAIALVSSALF